MAVRQPDYAKTYAIPRKKRNICNPTACFENICRDKSFDMTTVNPVKTHLEFYQKHQIAPVCYDLTSMQAHLERRSSLYLKLGLPPIAFRSAKVLEVAAGLGQNSLYIAHMLPEKLVLLEPN